MLITLLDALNAEVKSAAAATGCEEFLTASKGLDEVINLVETNQFGLASDNSGSAMIPITTAAVEAFEVLSAEGLL